MGLDKLCELDYDAAILSIVMAGTLGRSRLQSYRLLDGDTIQAFS